MSQISKNSSGGGGGTITDVQTANATPQFTAGPVAVVDFGASSNLVLGSSMPVADPGAVSNTGLGLDVLKAVTTGQGNTGVGAGCLDSVNTGQRNTCGGAGSGSNITSGVDNTAWGEMALFTASTAIECVAIGADSLANCNQSGLTAVGTAALNAITSNGEAAAFGYHSLTLCTGGGNSAFGFGSFQLLTSGTNNTGFGRGVGANLLTGSTNLFLGYNTGNAYTGSESSNILLQNLGTLAESNTIRIGTQGSGSGQQNRAFVAGIVGVTNSNAQMVTVDSTSGQLGAQAMPGYALALTQVAVFPAPVDSTTYYMTTAATWSTTIAGATTGRLWIPKSGTITAAYGSIAVTGTLGSNENTSVEIRLNNTTNTNITSTLQCTAALNTFNNSSLGISVVAGDYIHFQVICPAWATNPTNVAFNCSVIIT